jgi:hypothetical protein
MATSALAYRCVHDTNTRSKAPWMERRRERSGIVRPCTCVRKISRQVTHEILENKAIFFRF